MKLDKQSAVNLTKKLGLVVMGVAIFAAGWYLAPKRTIDTPPDVDVAQAVEEAEEQVKWTCSMHPQIIQNEPGDCPICGMDLIPLEAAMDEEAPPRQISFSKAATELMEVETSAVKQQFVEAEIRMVGKIDYDETRVKYITAWVPGRLDRLFVDYTGVRVRKGDHMVKIYSPDLLADQQALLSAIQSASNIKEGASDFAKQLAQNNIAAARERLRLLGLTEEQIKQIEGTAKPSEHITIYAPIGGVVIHKNAAEGMYVETGTRIYTIADLTQVWVKLDAYESDMTWIRYGQTVKFTTEAYPGEEFTGKISFIDPVLNEKTRTVKLRVNVPNPDGRLKPGMFVRAIVTPQVATGGNVMDPSMAGKFICPMHPSVVEENAGDCPICGMDLVTTESLGYMEIAENNRQAPVVVPDTAVLVTGTRAVVYVKVPNMEKPTFEGREIVLGPKAGDHYIVKQGLLPGDVVVTNGNFKIDSALQIQAKPSMMSPVEADGDHGSMKMPTPGEQTICPVMGGKINPELFVEYKGKRVYFCCPGCSDKFEADPEKYIKDLPQFQEDASQSQPGDEQVSTEQTVCPVMGGKIDTELFVEYKGKKVYFCCPGCSDKFLQNPDEYLDELPQFNPQSQ